MSLGIRCAPSQLPRSRPKSQVGTLHEEGFLVFSRTRYVRCIFPSSPNVRVHSIRSHTLAIACRFLRISSGVCRTDGVTEGVGAASAAFLVLGTI